MPPTQVSMNYILENIFPTHPRQAYGAQTKMFAKSIALNACNTVLGHSLPPSAKEQ